MTSVVLFGTSSFIRLVLKKRLSMHNDLHILGDFIPTDEDGLHLIAEKKPQIILFDLDVPSLKGLEMVQSIIKIHPNCAVIVLLNLSIGGAEVALKALEIGAVDFIHKESSVLEIDLHAFENALLAKIKQWSNYLSSLAGTFRIFSEPNTKPSLHAELNPRNLNVPTPVINPTWEASYTIPKKNAKKINLVLIGVSTGGPLTLLNMLSKIKKKLNCPIVIAQHMPPAFTKSLSSHLQVETSLNIVEGNHALLLEPGMIAIARGGIDSKIQRVSSNQFMLVEKKNVITGIHPSVDFLFTSASTLACEILAIILTGMGSDGLDGVRKLYYQGATIVAQNPDTCVVNGMPLSIIHAGYVHHILNPELVGELINEWCTDSDN